MDFNTLQILKIVEICTSIWSIRVFQMRDDDDDDDDDKYSFIADRLTYLLQP
jgi:hypothetical protein